MRTPEAIVKDKVKRILDLTGAYCFWPVQSGYGSQTLDCLGCYRGFFFAIETKRAGGKMTPMQRLTADKMQTAGSKVFLIDGDMTELENWLRGVKK